MRFCIIIAWFFNLFLLCWVSRLDFFSLYNSANSWKSKEPAFIAASKGEVTQASIGIKVASGILKPCTWVSKYIHRFAQRMLQVNTIRFVTFLYSQRLSWGRVQVSIFMLGVTYSNFSQVAIITIMQFPFSHAPFKISSTRRSDHSVKIGSMQNVFIKAFSHFNKKIP